MSAWYRIIYLFWCLWDVQTANSGWAEPSISLTVLLEKFWRILFYVTDDAIAKLDVPYSLVK